MKQLYLLLLAFMICVFGFEMLQVGEQQQISRQQRAYATCLQARNETGRQACNKAQAATHTEFICSQDNKYCWLEIK